MICKILLFLLFMAILNVIRESLVFRIALKLEQQLEISNVRILFLGISIAYILTIIFTGLTI